MVRSIILAACLLGAGKTALARDPDNKDVRDKVTSTDFGKGGMKSLAGEKSCFCRAGCFYNDPDSFDYTKTVDVPCNLALKEKKDRVAKDLLDHFMSAHGVKSASVILKSVSIQCYEVGSR